LRPEKGDPTQLSALAKVSRARRLGYEWASSWRPSRSGKAAFEDVEAYCFFIGYPRSGHSMIGAFLDAHPQAVIAQEMGAFQYLRARFDRDRIFYLLARNARAAATAGRVSREYRYVVPNQWQGRFERVRLIGDKKAEGATLRLRACPNLLDRLRRTVRVPLRVIHVVRNPFDNITTMATRAVQRALERGGSPGFGPDLSHALTRYRTLSDHVTTLKQELRDDIFELRHEDFIVDPRGQLSRLCVFLGLDPDPAYLDACVATVWGSARATRRDVSWSPDLRASVDQLIAETPHLAGYRFDS